MYFQASLRGPITPLITSRGPPCHRSLAEAATPWCSWQELHRFESPKNAYCWWKFNSSSPLENLQSQKERLVFQPSFFRDYLEWLNHQGLPRSGRRRKLSPEKLTSIISEKLLDQRPESTAADKVQARLTSRITWKNGSWRSIKVHQETKMIKNIWCLRSHWYRVWAANNQDPSIIWWYLIWSSGSIVSWNKGLKRIFVSNMFSPFKITTHFFPPSLDFHVWSLRLDQCLTSNFASLSCLVVHGNVFEKKFPLNMMLPWLSSSLNLKNKWRNHQMFSTFYG